MIAAKAKGKNRGSGRGVFHDAIIACLIRGESIGATAKNVGVSDTAVYDSSVAAFGYGHDWADRVPIKSRDRAAAMFRRGFTELEIAETLGLDLAFVRWFERYHFGDDGVQHARTPCGTDACGVCLRCVARAAAGRKARGARLLSNDEAEPESDDPTPEEIAERAAQVRAKWSTRVRKERAGQPKLGTMMVA